MTIRCLPIELANQIAAGEVIERPASVIKELIENSLDAGATRIDISTEQSGQKRIRISDNGEGIPADELVLALTRHATSKVETFDDLMSIRSLGFRGEALASIASVAQLTLTSRPAHQTVGSTIRSDVFPPVYKQMPAPHPIGTTIEVVDLFYNTPARKKFLKSTKTEQAAIVQLIERFGVAYPYVTFTYTSNHILLFQWGAVGAEKKKQRLMDVLGDCTSYMREVSLESVKTKITGISIHPLAPDKYSKLQMFFVNGRYIRDKILIHALKSVSDPAPGAVLFIEICPSMVDVNVHPTKHEVRFQDGRYIHNLVLQALKSSLGQELLAVNPDADIQGVSDKGASSYASPLCFESSFAPPAYLGPGSMSSHKPTSSEATYPQGFPRDARSDDRSHFIAPLKCKVSISDEEMLEESRSVDRWLMPPWMFVHSRDSSFMCHGRHLLSFYIHPDYQSLSQDAMFSLENHPAMCSTKTLLFPIVMQINEFLMCESAEYSFLALLQDKELGGALGFLLTRHQETLRLERAPTWCDSLCYRTLILAWAHAFHAHPVHQESNASQPILDVLTKTLATVLPLSALYACSPLEMDHLLNAARKKNVPGIVELSTSMLDVLAQTNDLL